MVSTKSFITAAAVFSVIASTPAVSYAAGAASITIAGPATVASGDTFTVSIEEVDAVAAQAVTAKFAFDATQVAFLGGSCGSTFTTYQPGSNAVTCYVPAGGSYSGSANVGVANFRALTTGNLAISTTTGSRVAAAGVDQWNGVASSMTVQSVAPTPAPVDPAPAPTPPPAPADGTRPVNPTATPKPRAATNTTRTTATATPQTTVAAPAEATKETPKPKADTDETKDATILGATASETVKAANKTPWVLMAVAVAVVAIAAIVVRRYSSDIITDADDRPLFMAAGARPSTANKRPAANKAAGAAKARKAKTAIKK